MTQTPPRRGPEPFETVFKPFAEKTEEMWTRMWGQVVGSEKFTEGLRQTLDRYLKAMNVPTRGDLEAVQRELGELKALVQRLETRLARPRPARARTRPRKRSR